MSYQQFRPAPFGQIPVVVKNIIIINVILYVAKLIVPLPLDNYLDLFYYKSHFFKPFQFVTYMFMHFDFGHLLFNMLPLYFLGSILERTWGPKRFLNFYLLSGLGAALAQYAVFYFQDRQFMDTYGGYAGMEGFYEAQKMFYDNMVCLGASGAVFGILTGFAMLFPNTQLYIYFLVPVKAKWLVLFYGLAELFYGVAQQPGDNVAHFAHLGGALVGVIIVLIWKRNRKQFY